MLAYTVLPDDAVYASMSTSKIMQCLPKEGWLELFSLDISQRGVGGGGLLEKSYMFKYSLTLLLYCIMQCSDRLHFPWMCPLTDWCKLLVLTTVRIIS